MNTVKVTNQIIQEVDIEFPIPSYWKEKESLTLSFISFHSSEASTKVMCSPYGAFLSVSKPSKSDFQEAATKMVQISEQEFWNHYNDAKRRIESFEPCTEHA